MKLRRTLMISKKLFWSLKHDKRSLALIIFAPIMAMFIFGLAFSGEVEDVDVIIVNEDTGGQLGPMNATIRFSELVIGNMDEDTINVRYSDDIDDAIEEVEDGDANSVIIFPENFTSNLLRFKETGQSDGETAISIRSDQSQVTVSQEVITAVMEAIKRTNEENGFENPATIDTSDPIYGKGATFLDMFVPGIMGFVVFLLTTILTLISFVGERTRGTLQRLLASSVTEGEIVIGYAISFGIIGMVQVGILMVLAITVFGIMVEGNPLIAFLIASILAVVSVSLGILLSSLARREAQAIQFLPLIILPGFLLSGVFWPIEAMPSWLRPVSYFIPVTYAVNGLRSVLLRGWGVFDIWFEIVMLLVFMVGFLCLAILTLKKMARE